MKKNITSNPRLLAISALSDVLDRRLNMTESTALTDSPRSRDLSLGRHLTYGILRWLTALEWLAQQLLNKPIKQRDRDIQRLVLLGLHQLWQDNTPPHAAIHETAECARHLGKPWAVGMINAVLRRFQREREDWLVRLATEDESFAHPKWLLEKIRMDWPEQWQGIAQANNLQAHLWLRVNRRGPGKSVLIERLEAAGFEIETHPRAADALKVSPAAHIDALPGFDEGYFSVQDPAAQLAADLLDLEEGMHVLDACAAPGGKTCHILERATAVTMTAVDPVAHRLDLIRQSLDRLQLDASLIKGDATDPASWWDGRLFQRILLDAPCSASGVIRRHPEIKHLRQTSQVEDAVGLQGRLLKQLWPLLAPGGILVYATCSIFHDENSRQINNFLEQHSDAEEQVIDADWGQTQTSGRQILPGEQDMDGFYYAILRKPG